MAVPKKYLDQAAGLQEAHSRQAEKIRSRTELTAAAKRGMLAANYNAHRNSMEQLQQTAAAETATQSGDLNRTAFGMAGLPGDPAMVASSFRDAQDRAAQLIKSADAATLLARAERSGDELLARAVAGVAYENHTNGATRVDPGWTDVVNTYLDRRPGNAAAATQLAELDRPDIFSAIFAFVVPPPPELAGIPSGQLAKLIAAAPDAA
jgi:hypothetical protein